MPRVEIYNPDEVINDYLAGTSENQLAKRCGVSRPALGRFLERNGIKRRTVTQANRLMMQSRSPSENRRNVVAAHKAVRGRKQSMSEKRKRALTRERKQLNVSPGELWVAEMLKQRGIEVTLQKAAGIYNIDLAFNNIGVEIYGGGWHSSGRHARRSNERFTYLLKNHWRMIIVWVDQRSYPMGASLIDLIENHIRSEQTSGEFVVVRGDGSVFAQGGMEEIELLTVRPTLT